MRKNSACFLLLVKLLLSATFTTASLGHGRVLLQRDYSVLQVTVHVSNPTPKHFKFLGEQATSVSRPRILKYQYSFHSLVSRSSAYSFAPYRSILER